LLLATSGSFAADAAAAAQAPLKVLYVTCGGYHDYATQTPYLTTNISQLVNATFEVKLGLEALNNPKFAEGYDAVFYNVCEDKAPDQVLDNAMQTARNGKPTVMMHCSIHAFRYSPKIKEWETFCGLRSKVHDAYGPFTITKADQDSPITKFLPQDWKTAGDELYQTIAIDPQSHQLLRAKSPVDGRQHIVCWTSQFGQGRVFCTTLGHEMKTCATPEFRQLLANGLLWACGKLGPDGVPAPGYSVARARPNG
jgi:type 1 glutamine amidotransferase